MKDKKFALKMIRDYHSILLKSVETTEGIKEMIKKDDFMDMKWKIRVAKLLTGAEIDSRAIVDKIRELREEYNCREF